MRNRGSISFRGVSFVACAVLVAVLATAGCSQEPAISAAPQQPDGAALSKAAIVQSLDFREIVQSAKDKVFPAVVFVKAIRESNESGKKISEEVSGSGVIISAKGELLTNWHVVDKASQLRCLLYDGRYFDAKTLGSDKDTDLALLQLQLPKDAKPVSYASIGDSAKLKEGDFVMAMGAPWGLSRSVSIGIVSCTTRYLPSTSEYNLWLQTDASISPGNSGGPLVNTQGEVIGINSRGTSGGGDIGFAIPSQTFVVVADQLGKYGKMNWSWMGLQLQSLRDFDKNIYFDADEGVIVAETDPESPARRAGILQRDRIVRVNDIPVTATWPEDLPTVNRMLGLLPKGDKAKIELVRGHETKIIEIIPREKGKVEGDELECKRWDMTLKTINQFDNPDLYFQRENGVFVYGVKYPGNADNAGLQREDIILQIDGKDVATLDDVKVVHKQLVDNVAKKHRIRIRVLREGLERQLIMDFSRDYEKE